MSFLKVFPLTLMFLFVSSNLMAETINDLIRKADSSLQNQEYRAALIHLKNAAKQSPTNLSVRLHMARLFIHTGQGVQAQVEIDKANRLGAKPADTAVLSAKAKMLLGEFNRLTENISLLDLPQNEIARLRAIQGHAFFEQRKFSKAKQMFQRAISLSPLELEVELGQAKLYQLNGNSILEKKLIESLLSRVKGNSEVLIVAGNHFRNNGNYDRALELFKKAGEIQPSNVNVWFGVVRTHISMKNYNDAKTEIQKVLSSYPEHQVANYLLSVIAFEEGDYTRAKAAIEIVLKGEKRKFEALKMLGTIQFQQKEYSSAEETLKKYLKYHADDKQALKILASIYIKRRQGVLALEILNQLEEMDDAYIYSMIATAYLHLGNKEKSDLYITKSIQKAPNDRVIQRHFQRSQLEAGVELDIEFKDDNFENFLTEGHIPVLSLMRQEKYDRAIEIINGYLKKTPENSLLFYLLGSTYLYQNKTEQAQKEFLNSLKVNPEFIESRIYLAKIYQKTGKTRDAEREYREVLRIDKNNDQAMVALAGIYNRAGNEEEMLKWLNKSRKTNSASLASREVLEHFYHTKGKFKKALEFSGEMISIQPQNVSLLLKHANNQKALKRLDKAIETFQQIVKLKPELPSAWFGLGRLQYLYNSLQKAKSSFQKVLKFEPDNLTAKVILVQIDLKLNKLDQALQKAKNIQQQHPESPAGFDMLGDIYIVLKKPGMAIQQYKQSVKLKYSSETYIKLHSAYNKNNQIKKGFDLLKQWTDQYPDDLELKEVLAITYQRRGEFKKALKLYQTIIRKWRNNDRILNNLALVSLELNSPMSVEYAEMAFNINPENNKNKDTLGWVLLNNDSDKKALALLKEAVEESPSDPDIRYHYAVALVKHNEKDKAKKQLYLATSIKSVFLNRRKAEKLLNQLE